MSSLQYSKAARNQGRESPREHYANNIISITYSSEKSPSARPLNLADNFLNNIMKNPNFYNSNGLFLDPNSLPQHMNVRGVTLDFWFPGADINLKYLPQERLDVKIIPQTKKWAKYVKSELIKIIEGEDGTGTNRS